MRENNHKDVNWHEGMDVYVQSRGGWDVRPMIKSKISKVHKTGRFNVDIEGAQQFRGDTYLTGWSGSSEARLQYTKSTGSGHRLSTWVFPVNDETTSEMNKVNNACKARRSYANIYNALPNSIDGNEEWAGDVCKLLAEIDAKINPKA